MSISIKKQALNNAIHKLRTKTALKLMEKYATCGVYDPSKEGFKAPPQAFIAQRMGFYVNGMTKMPRTSQNPNPFYMVERIQFITAFKEHDEQRNIFKILELMQHPKHINLEFAPLQLDDGDKMVRVESDDYPFLWTGIGYEIASNAFWLWLSLNGYDRAPTISELVDIITPDYLTPNNLAGEWELGDEPYAGEANELDERSQKENERSALYDSTYDFLLEMAGTSQFHDTYELIKENFDDFKSKKVLEDKANETIGNELLDSGLI